MPGGAVHLLLPHGIPGTATVPVCNRECQFFRGACFLSKLPTFGPRRISLICGASPNNYRRNSEFSRQQRGSSRGKSKQYQERDDSENIDESDVFSSKNGPLHSLTSNPRYQATPAPGQREKEIVELFKKVQAQLRARAANKEEKKPESAKGQGERGTVDSLLKLLRKHSVDQRRRTSVEREYNVDQTGRSNDSEDEQKSNIFGPNTNTQAEVNEPAAVSFKRPTSKFSRRSPVPTVKFQPILFADGDADADADATSDADDDINAVPKSKKTRAKKKAATYEPESVLPPENISLDDSGDDISDDESDASDTEESHEDALEPSLESPDALDTEESQEETLEPSSLESSDIGSLKVTELRELAKSRGIKGYSKMKKNELVELLSNTA